MKKIALVATVSLIMTACSGGDGNWSSFGGGPGMRNVSEAKTNTTVSRQWDYGYQRLMSMVWPVADSEYVYAIVDNPQDSLESILVKVEKSSGKIAGEPFSLGRCANCSIAISQQHMIVSDGQKVSKHDKKTMSLVWEYQLGDEENVFQVTAIEDVIFFVTDMANVYCINKDTGMVRWQQKADDRYNYRWGSSNGEVSLIEGFIPDGNMKVMAFSTYTGDFLWEFETEGDASVPAQISGKRVVISSTGQIAALDVETGKILWSMLVRDASGLPVKLIKPGCFFKDSFYLVNGNRLVGVDAQTGTTIDEAVLPYEFPAISMVASSNAIYIALYGDPFLIAYSLDDKSFSKQIEGSRTVVGMAVSDGLAVQCLESLMFLK